MIPKNCGGEYPEWKDIHLEDENSRFVGKFPNVCQTCNYIGACMFKIIHQERTGETIELSEESRQHIAKTYLESMGERQSTILQ